MNVSYRTSFPIPVHRKLRYDPGTGKGCVEIITTPFYHPILPLLIDTDLAREGQPHDPLPPRFRHPEDAEAQVLKSVAFYKELFGSPPRGMWPAEGAVAQAGVPVFARAGITWIATGDGVLRRSKPAGLPCEAAYAAGDESAESVAVFFRDTELSDRIGFTYQSWKPEDAVEDFTRRVLAHSGGERGRVLTVILDGENAWEHYKFDFDGKKFIDTLYRRLGELQAEGKLLTVTPSEYIFGNPLRGVPPHPLHSLPRIKRLFAGSWIGGTLSTWIGEGEENRAWELLGKVRRDLERSGLKPPVPGASEPEPGTPADFARRAWESLYAAEGSDWFWWYGSDQASGSDELFDAAFIGHLKNVYLFAKKAGARIEPPPLEPIIKPRGRGGRLVSVLFTCSAKGIEVPEAIYIVGGERALGNWNPNTVRMYDDGTHGDFAAGDGVWSLRVLLPEESDIEYKYTNSGRPGEWSPSEEFPAANRKIRVKEGLIVLDTFGKK